MGGWDPRAWGAHREGGMLPILPTNAHPSSLSCPQGGLGDGDSQDLSGNEAGDPQNLWSNRPGDQAGWERGTVRGHGGGDERGMISAPLPSPGPPRPANPWEGHVQVDPCKGGKEQLHDPGGASSSFPPLGGERNRRFGEDKKSQEKPQWVGRSFPHPRTSWEREMSAGTAWRR